MSAPAPLSDPEPAPADDDVGPGVAPLLSVQLLRPLAVRAALVGVIGAACGPLFGAVAESVTGFAAGSGLSLMGLWWAGMILPLGLLEVWAERRAASRRGRVLLTLGGVVVLGWGLLVLGGLQYQYGVGVLREGSLEAGYERVLRVLRFLTPWDGLVVFAIFVPFLADAAARLFLARAWAQAGACVLVVACTSLPLVVSQADRTGPLDQALLIQAVLLCAVIFSPSARWAERLCATRWPAPGAPG